MKKKKMNPTKYILLFFFFSLLLNKNVIAQEDSVVKEKILKLHYVNSNNSMQYLLVQTLLKAGKKTEPLKNIPVQVFLDSNSEANLIGKLVSDDEGLAKAFIPVTLKTNWDASSKHKFIAVPDFGSKEEVTPTEVEITKARITLDTSSEDGTRSITVMVEKFDNGKWVPVKDVEMKLGIQRLGGILSAGEAETYTTDSSGSVKVEFKKDSMPGDRKGNIVLIAKVDDNDLLGSLIAEKQVLWGVPGKEDNSFFDQRTLWSTRFRTPYWLLFMAYSIVIGVWGTLLYLVSRLIKIRKLGLAKK
jgi:hypothetical protein